MVKYLVRINIQEHLNMVILCNEVDLAAAENCIRDTIGNKTLNEILDEWKNDGGKFEDSGFEVECLEFVAKN